MTSVNFKIFVLTFAVFLISAKSYPIEEIYQEEPSFYRPLFSEDHLRIRRQAQISGNKNPDGSLNLNANIPLVGNDKNVLSAIGAVNGLRDEKPSFLNQHSHGYDSAAAGLSLQNSNGHSLTGLASHVPSFGDQLTLAGKASLLNTDNHNLNANAFITRNMPKMPEVPNFNTHGGSLDYMYKNKVGGSFGVAQTPRFQQTDYSALANMNLFRDRTSSLDLNAGATRSISPFIPRSNWEPTFGLTFKKSW